MNEFRFICARLILGERVLKILSVTERHRKEDKRVEKGKKTDFLFKFYIYIFILVLRPTRLFIGFVSSSDMK